MKKTTMRKFDARKVQELLASLKNRLADLTEDKNYMLSTCEFDCPQDEWEYDCILEEIDEVEESIDKLYDIIYSEGYGYTVTSDNIADSNNIDLSIQIKKK